jgi:hypothetical protein
VVPFCGRCSGPKTKDLINNAARSKHSLNMSFTRGQVFEDSDDEGPSWGDQKQAEETASRSTSLIGGNADDKTNVQVRFVTKLPENMRVSQDPIALPATLTRFALSEIINHLLALSKSLHFPSGIVFLLSLTSHLISSHLSLSIDSDHHSFSSSSTTIRFHHR